MLRIVEHDGDGLVAALRPEHLGQSGPRVGRAGIASDHPLRQVVRLVDPARGQRDQCRTLQHTQLIAVLQRLEQRVRLLQTTHALIQHRQLDAGEDVVEAAVRTVGR